MCAAARALTMASGLVLTPPLDQRLHLWLAACSLLPCSALCSPPGTNIPPPPPPRWQVLKGNIRVMVRVRPPSPGSRPVLAYPLDGLLSITPGDGRRYQEYEFDAVFSPEVGQAQVFQEVSPLVRSAADGYNVSGGAGRAGDGGTCTRWWYDTVGTWCSRYVADDSDDSRARAVVPAVSHMLPPRPCCM
jgi:hypothetical protein